MHARMIRNRTGPRSNAIFRALQICRSRRFLRACVCVRVTPDCSAVCARLTLCMCAWVSQIVDFFSAHLLVRLVYSFALHITIYRHIHQGCCTAVFALLFLRLHTASLKRERWSEYNRSSTATINNSNKRTQPQRQKQHDIHEASHVVAKMVSLQQVCSLHTMSPHRHRNRHTYIPDSCIRTRMCVQGAPPNIGRLICERPT